MPDLAVSLNRFFKERLEAVLRIIESESAAFSEENGEWIIRNSPAIDDTARYHLAKLVKEGLAKRENIGRNIKAWAIPGPPNLPELIRNQIKEIDKPVATNDQLEDMLLGMADEVVNLQKIVKE